MTSDHPQAEPGAKCFRALPDARSPQSATLVSVTPRPPVAEPAEAADAETADAGRPEQAPPAPAGGEALPPGPPAGIAQRTQWAATWAVTVRLTGGMGNARTPREGSVPAAGDPVTFTFFEHDPRSGPALPDAEQTPWTHGGPPGADRPTGATPPETPTADAPTHATATATADMTADTAPDPVTAEDFL